MLKHEGQAFIVCYVNLHNKVLCDCFSEKINFSEDAIHRDLQELSEMENIIRLHGGTLSKSFHSSFYTLQV